MTRNDVTPLPSVEGLKAQARRLRETLAGHGTAVSHSQSLELMARQLGYRDWNTLRAAADAPRPNRAQPPVSLGQRVAGRYLSQPFTGEVIAIRQMADGSHFQVTLQFDDPVDVVTFDSFSAFRRRVTATIDRSGRTPAATSDGAPQMKLTLEPSNA